MAIPKTAVLHYTTSPVVGGVEIVIHSHAQAFVQAGYPIKIIAGRGEAAALPPGTGFTRIPEMDSQHAEILAVGPELEQARVPPAFAGLVDRLAGRLRAGLQGWDTVIVHNVFTKHFNLPLTAALDRLLDRGEIGHCISWCHDFTWTSPSSRHKVHPGYPWDVLRTYRPEVTYVTVSQGRQRELAGLLGCPEEKIRVVYNGVDPQALLGLSAVGQGLVERLAVFSSDLVLLMPVRVTRLKNVELALRVLAELKGRGYRPRLIMTGPPDPHDQASQAYYASLLAMRRELGLEAEMRFVYESGPDPTQPFIVDLDVVGELFRVSDALFIPSHREGFGMPVLEAGLAGLPVISSETVPAAQEIGGEGVLFISPEGDPAEIAARLAAWLEANPGYRLRRRVRQNYTWQAIFERDIAPLLRGERAQ